MKHKKRKPVQPCSPAEQRIIVNNAQLFARCCKPFKKVFGKKLHNFWLDNVRGFRPEYLAVWLDVPMSELKDYVEAAHGVLAMQLLGVVAGKITQPIRVDEILKAVMCKGKEEVVEVAAL